MPEVIKYEEESKSYQSTDKNIAELLPWVESQVKEELDGLQDEVKKNFFEEKEGTVTYRMDLVKKYLESCIQKEDFKINSVVVMAVQIGLESLGEEKYDVGVIDGLLKSNSGKASDTEKAIMKFQEDNGLKVDGIPGKKTIGILLKKIGELGNNGNVQNASNDKKREKSVFEVRRNKQATNNGNVDLQDLRYDNLIKNKNGRHDPEKPQVSIDHGNEKEQDAEIIVQGAKTEEQVEQTPTADSEATTLPTEEAAIEAANDAEAKAAKNKVITLIASLPEENAITLNDKNTIIEARKAYNALAEADRSEINTDKLTKAETKVKALETAEVERSQQIQNIQSQIDKLSGYAVGKESVIKDARDAYDALAGNLRGDIDLSKLEKAENERVQYVEELINKLPKPADITIDDESKINEARNAYQKLYGNLSIKVNLMTLINAENALGAVKSKEKARLEEESRRQLDLDPNIVTNPEVSVNITPDYADSNHFELKNRNAYLNIDILQGPKLEATNIDEVGGIGSSMMEGFSNADYNTSKTEGSITCGYGKTIKNMRWGRGAGTRSINRFWKEGEKGVLEEEKLKRYCDDRGIKSFVLYFGGNEARFSQQAVDNAYNDIKLMCEYLSNIGVQPVLCTCIGENKIEHSVGGNGKIYLLPEFNNKIRELGRLNNWPVIDYAKIDIGNVWYPSSTSTHPSFSHGYPEMRQKILDNLSQ